MAPLLRSSLGFHACYSWAD